MKEIDLLNKKKGDELAAYEKKLKKVCSSSSTQTHDGFHRRVKEL